MPLFRRRALADQLARLQAEMEALNGALDEERAASAALAARLGELERQGAALESEHVRVRARVDEVGAVLTRQIGEMSGDLDGLADGVDHVRGDLAAVTSRLPEGTIATIDHVEELRGNQAAIANELVRYEIALREDVAVLAARLPSRH
jgi:chromosome segregation ATPase